MAVQTWEQLINAYQSAAATGAAYVSSKTLTNISPGGLVVGEACTIPGGYLNVGSIIRYTARGWFSNAAASKPTFVMGLYWGGVAGKALAVTAANETPETSTELPWEMEASTRITAIGEKGKAMTHGMVTGLGTPKAAISAGVTSQHLPATKPQTEIEINTAAQNVLTLGGTWGTESASNTLTVIQWLVELLN